MVLSAGLLPEERTQRDRRADVHAAAHVQENQTDEDGSRQVRGETDHRGDRESAGVRGQYIPWCNHAGCVRYWDRDWDRNRSNERL